MEDTENREELILVVGEDGKVSLYEEPYATIEVKTEEDYNFLLNAIEKQATVKPIVEKEMVLKYLNNFLEYKFEDKERKELWRYDPKRMEMDKDLDAIERVMYLIKKC